jgi:hypothetical protein
VNETDWDSCTDPQVMLAFLRHNGKLSERKARLFAVACCRRIWSRIPAGYSRQAVETSERYADGEVSFEELEAAFLAADRVHSRGSWQLDTLDAARLAAHPETRGLADETAAAAAAAMASGASGVQDYWQRYASERACQFDLLRDLLGPLPFRPLTLPPSVRTWNDGLLQRLAEAAYEHLLLPSGQLDPERLGVLADALEEAGADAEMVEHLRQPRALHVRGCWALDLALGRS